VDLRLSESHEVSVDAQTDQSAQRRTEHKGAAFEAIDVARDGKSMRVRFAAVDGEISVSVPPDNLSQMIPVLIRAEAQGYKNAGIPNALRVFATSDVRVSVAPDRKHLDIAMILPEDAGRIGFRVDLRNARGLLRIVAEALRAAGAPLPTPH
jgi:hypothetical protein